MITAITDDTTLEKTPPQVHTAVSYDGELSQSSDLGNKFYAKVRQMRRDPTVKLVRQFAVAPLVASKWSVECTENAPEGAKEFIEKQVERHRLDLITKSMYGMIDYGWQSFERVIEDTPDGLWGIKWLKPLLHDITTIMVDPRDGAFMGVRQEPLSIVNTPVQLAPQINLSVDDVMLFSADVEGTGWYGEPVMKAIEGIYDEQAQINKSARKYDARIAGSHWVVYFPLGVSKYKGAEIDNGEIAKELIQGIEAMGGIALPRSVVQAYDALNAQAAKDESLQWKLDLLSDKGSGQTPFLERFKYLDILKVRAFGYPERAMLEGQFGTKAEAEAHTDLAILNFEMKHAQLVQQVNKQYVDWFLYVNWGPDAVSTVYITPAPLADRAIAFFRKLYETIIANPEGFANEAAVVDWMAVREQLGLPPARQTPMETDIQQLDELMPPIEGMPVTDPELIPEPLAFGLNSDQSRAEDGKFGSGGGGNKGSKFKVGKEEKNSRGDGVSKVTVGSHEVAEIRSESIGSRDSAGSSREYTVAYNEKALSVASGKDVQVMSSSSEGVKREGSVTISRYSKHNSKSSAQFALKQTLSKLGL